MVKQSMSSALSSYQYSGNNTIDSYQVEDDFSDVAAFRLTKNPALNDETHVPTVVNASLLDDTNTFDFATFFETVFQSAVINQLNGNILVYKIKLVVWNQQLMNTLIDLLQTRMTKQQLMN